VTIAGDPPSDAAARLANRLRDLREHAPRPLTQSELGQALGIGKSGGAQGPVAPATVSSWENAASGRLVPASRLDSYARLFSTPRSFEGGAVHLLGDRELTADERDALAQLREELITLREIAAGRQDVPAREPRSIWHFPDGSPITLACARLPPEMRPTSSNPDNLDYVRLSDLADLDSLIDIYGAIRAYNPESRVVIKAGQDLTQRDVAHHLVLIGGMAWATLSPQLSRIFPIPIQTVDPADGGVIVVSDPGVGDLEFAYRLVDGVLVEDVGYFARGPNPSAPFRTMTVCGGITTRGVHGAARCFIEPEVREHNEQYLFPRFPEGSTYCVVMRVPVINRDPLTPDLSKKENRLFEWDNSGAKAE
jgi:transcriptional regulator with XRE-family HTH domain